MQKETISNFVNLTNTDLYQITCGKSVLYHIEDGIVSFCSGVDHGFFFS